MNKAIITIAVFALTGVCVFAIGLLASPDVSLPKAITPDSACPATSCASGSCHGFDDVPEPDGIHQMVCPESGCASVACHAWDTLMDRYGQASDMSLNLWILFPTLAVVALVALVLHDSTGRKGKNATRAAAQTGEANEETRARD